MKLCRTIKRLLLVAMLLTAVAARAEEAPAYTETRDSIEALLTPIFGENEIDLDRVYRFIKKHNANFSREVVDSFYEIGSRYGIRSDIAMCQAILETGWFRFLDGTMVTPDQYNFGGLGVTALGEKGNSFTSLEEGVTAFMQHLYAYACAEELPEGEALVDQRFNLVKRGSAPTWGELSGRWAMNPNYGKSIMRLYRQMRRFSDNGGHHHHKKSK